jgi:hypothetical protein
MGGERLPAPPRERKPALAALAVLLILVGALGATLLVMRAGDKISVVEIVSPVASGDKIPESAIREVMISDVTDDSALHFITWGQRGDLLKNYRAKTNLYPQSVLTQSMLTTGDDVVPAGKSLVGMSLKVGEYPSKMGVGSTVAAYRVGNDATKSEGDSGTSGDGSTGSASTLISGNLIVKGADGDSSGLGGGDLSVTVLVDTADAGPLTIAAAANEVALVLVPTSSN